MSKKSTDKQREGSKERYIAEVLLQGEKESEEEMYYYKKLDSSMSFDEIMAFLTPDGKYFLLEDAARDHCKKSGIKVEKELNEYKQIKDPLKFWMWLSTKNFKDIVDFYTRRWK